MSTTTTYEGCSCCSSPSGPPVACRSCDDPLTSTLNATFTSTCPLINGMTVPITYLDSNDYCCDGFGNICHFQGTHAIDCNDGSLPAGTCATIQVDFFVYECGYTGCACISEAKVILSGAVYGTWNVL